MLLLKLCAVCTGKAGGGNLSSWITAPHDGNPNWVSGSWIRLSPALVVVGIWGRLSRMGDLSVMFLTLCISLCLSSILTVDKIHKWRFLKFMDNVYWERTMYGLRIFIYLFIYEAEREKEREGDIFHQQEVSLSKWL